jgi:hypothetical protein
MITGIIDMMHEYTASVYSHGGAWQYGAYGWGLLKPGQEKCIAPN